MQAVYEERQNQTDIEQKLTSHFAGFMEDENGMKAMRNRFRRDGYLNFKNFSFLPKTLLEGIHQEVHHLLSKNAIRRDVSVASTGSTYRKMYNVN